MGITFNCSELQRGTSSMLHAAQEPLLDKKKDRQIMKLLASLRKGNCLD